MLEISLQSDENIQRKLPAYFAERLLSDQLDKFESHADSNIISFDFYDVEDTDAAPQQITIYMGKSSLLFFCESHSVYEKVQNLAQERDTDEQTLYWFFSELIKGDMLTLETLEGEIIAAEDEALSKPRSSCLVEVSGFRRKLFVMKKYYEQLNSIFEGLVENENGLISEEKLRYFVILDSRIDRLYDNVRNLRDYVTQVREAYQAQIDIEQNSLMKTFTVITSIFMPLTLIAGWYGMNLKMPEFGWNWGYPFVIIISAIVVLLAVIIFKKKKWM